MRDTDAREQQTQVVGDFRHRADRRAWALAERLLLDGDGGAQAVDALDVGLGQLVEKLTRISRQALDIPALSFGVDRVERERALAGPARARNDHEPIARQLDIDVVQVVLLCAANDQMLHPARPSSTSVVQASCPGLLRWTDARRGVKLPRCGERHTLGRGLLALTGQSNSLFRCVLLDAASALGGQPNNPPRTVAPERGVD